MVVLGERVAACVAGRSLGQGKGQPAEERGKGHRAARVHIAAVRVRLLEIREDEAHGLDGHEVGNRLVIAAPVALERVGESVKPGVHGGARRDGGEKHRVHDSRGGHEHGVIDGLFLRAVADDGDLSHLTACAGGGGDGDYGEALFGEGLSAVIVKGLAVAERGGRGEFRGVDGAAAADTDHGVGVMSARETHRLLNAGELRILLHAGENRADTAVLFRKLLRLRGEMPAADEDAAGNGEAIKHVSQLFKSARAEIYLYGLGVNELIYHRCYPRWP